jgi:PP-loop superfamily ATP-utilizing enzyme
MASRRRLETVLRGIGPLAVAVSGGVDSMTLAVLAQWVLGASARMLHAVRARSGSMAALDASTTHRLERRIRGLVAAAGIDQPVSFQRYRMGSAFLRPAHDR